MTAPVTNLQQWRIEHPPAVNLMAVWLNCWISMATMFWFAGTNNAAAVFKFKPRSSLCHNPRHRL